MKKNALSILALLLLASSLTLSTFPAAKAVHAPITIDGDPSDWIGTAPATNTWDWSEGEWIWTDEVGDDTGNGTYTYPWENNTAFSGAEADLTELRMAWNASHVMFLLRFANITENAWWTGSPYLTDVQAETTAVAICIDTDHAAESGSQTVEDETGDTQLEINLTSTGWWEYYFEISLDDVALWRWDVDFEKVALATREIPTAVNVDNDYEAIEVAIPIDADGLVGLPDPEGTDWSLFCFVGLQDYHHFREVNAVNDLWNGGGGTDDVVDPDAYDCAFFATKAEQEAALNGFSEADGTVCVISTYKQIPEFPLPFSFALIAIVVLAVSLKMRKKLYT